MGVMRVVGRWRLAALVVVLCSGLMVVPSTVSAGAADQLNLGATVRIQTATTPTQWDPAKTVSGVAQEFAYLSQVYDRLMFLNYDNKLLPMLASSWVVSPNAKTVTLQLRSDVTFHDGSKLNAGVVVQNLNRNRAAASATAALLDGVSGVTASGPSTVVVTLKKPDTSFVNVLATTAGMMVSPKGIADPSLRQKPAGSGPYILARTTQNVAFYDRNPSYWDKSLPISAHKTVGFAGRDASINGLRTGAYDLINSTAAQYPDAQSLVRTGNFVLRSYPSPFIYAVYLNATKGPLKNAQVRKALNMAIDRNAINNAILDGKCDVSSQPFPDGWAGHDNSAEIKYDPSAAKKILDDQNVRGYAPTIIFPNLEPYRSMAQIIQAELQDVGIKPNLQIVAQGTLVRFARGGDDMALVASAPLFADSASIMDWSNFGQMPMQPPSDLQGLITAAKSQPMGSTARDAAWRKITTYTKAEPTHLQLCFAPTWFIHSKKVSGGDHLAGARLSTVPDTRFVAIKK